MNAIPSPKPIASHETKTMTMTASERVAAYATAFDPASLTPADLRQCGRSLFDTLAVAIAGQNEPAAQRARRYVDSQHGIDATRGPSRARLWGSDATAPLEAAALFNGVAGHVLDFDDVTSTMRGHPSIALWPALLALADARDLPGARLASAFTIGFEVIVKLARAMAWPHYTRGWHSTESIGTIAATVAAAHLIGLDAKSTVHAIGLAVSQTGGTRENFGTDAKSFQAGQTGASALRSVLMAEVGFDSAPSALDGPLGYANLYAEGEDLRAAFATLGEPPIELHRGGIEIKQYPLCFATHHTLDGLLALRREHDLTLDRVASVRVETSGNALAPLIHHRPTSGLQGKFSIEYAVAAALADGAVRLSSFTDAAVRRPQLAAFLPNVQAIETARPSLPRSAEVIVTLKDGLTLKRFVETLHGSPADPLSDEELRTKGADCFAFAERPIDAGALLERMLRIGRLPARSLLDAVPNA